MTDDTKPMTREQVEAHLGELLLASGIVQDMKVIENLADTDAALRAQLQTSSALANERGNLLIKLRAEVEGLKRDLQEAVRLVRIGQPSDVERFANDGD